MKLLRFKDDNNIKPGILDSNNVIRDVSSMVKDWDCISIANENLKKIKQIDISTLPPVNANVSLAPCVDNVGKFICIGLNYSDHAAETGMEVPKNLYYL